MFNSKRILAACSPILLLAYIACANAFASEDEKKADSTESAKKNTGSDNPVLRLKLSRSSPKTRPSAFAETPARRWYGASAKGAPIVDIVKIVMEAAHTRLVVSPSLPDIRYDFDYAIRRVDDVPIYKPLIDAIVADSGVQISETEAERHVWVARVGDQKPPESTRRPKHHQDKDGFNYHDYTIISRFLRTIEGRYRVLIDDETELNGAYDLRYRPGDDFATVRKQITEDLGIEFTLEKRKTRIIEITFPSPPAQEPKRPAQDNASGVP